MPEGDTWSVILWTFRVDRIESWFSSLAYLNMRKLKFWRVLLDNRRLHYDFLSCAHGFIDSTWGGSYLDVQNVHFHDDLVNLLTALWFLLLPSHLYNSTLQFWCIFNNLLMKLDLVRAGFPRVLHSKFRVKAHIEMNISTFCNQESSCQANK